MIWTLWIVLGGVLGASGVAMGAFAAHYLKNRIDANLLNVFEVAVRYQMYHAIVLICLGFIATRVENGAIKFAGVFFFLGTLLFSGSLYGLVFFGNRMLGMITPFGGVLLILAWLLLAFSVLRIT